jgi:hypothetical protein
MLMDVDGELTDKEQDKGWKEMKGIIPMRTFEGPARSIRPYHITDKEDREWLEDFSRRVPMGGLTLELLNFADGKRSIYDIAMALSVEFVNLEPSDAMRFYSVCESMGKITFL